MSHTGLGATRLPSRQEQPTARRGHGDHRSDQQLDELSQFQIHPGEKHDAHTLLWVSYFVQGNESRRRLAETTLGKTSGGILVVGVTPTSDYGRAVLVASNEALTFVPTAVIVVMQATTIRANITAYSTAVGPSSDARNFFKRFMVNSLSLFDDLNL